MVKGSESVTNIEHTLCRAPHIRNKQMVFLRIAPILYHLFSPKGKPETSSVFVIKGSQ